MSGSVTEMCEDVAVNINLPQMAQRKMRGSSFWGPSLDLNDRIPTNPLNRKLNETGLNSRCHYFGFRLARNSGN